MYQVVIEDENICGCYEHSQWTVEENTYFTTPEKARELRDREVEEYVKDFGCEITSKDDLSVTVSDRKGCTATIRIIEVEIRIDPVVPSYEQLLEKYEESALGDLEALRKLKEELERGY